MKELEHTLLDLAAYSSWYEVVLLNRIGYFLRVATPLSRVVSSRFRCLPCLCSQGFRSRKGGDRVSAAGLPRHRREGTLTFLKMSEGNWMRCAGKATTRSGVS